MDDEVREEAKIDEVPQAGVFLYVKEVNGGRIVDFDILGGYDPLAIPSLCELAHKLARKRLGIDP